MKTIILPGFSAHNLDWANEVAKNLGGKDILVHNWLHWKNGKSNLNLKEEVNIIKDEVSDEKVNVIAKSVGTMVLAYLLKNNSINVGKIILCGIPSVSEERKNLFMSGLSGIADENIVVFQNSKDPFANYSDVKKFMDDVNSKIKVIEMPRSDHNYPYFEEFKKLINFV